MSLFKSNLLERDAQLNYNNYYEASVQRPLPQPALRGSSLTDVVVIGGGFAGLSAALELRAHGFNVTLLEAQRICSGASGRNGGQAIVGFACNMHIFEKQLGLTLSQELWNMSIEAINMIKQRSFQYNIDCEHISGYIYSADSKSKSISLIKEIEHIHKNYDFRYDLATGINVQKFIKSDRYLTTAYENVSGHLHPLKYGLGLAQAALHAGILIHENTTATHFTKITNFGNNRIIVHTHQGCVNAQYVLIAGNCTLSSYSAQIMPQMHARIMPVGTYMVATKPLPEEKCAELIPSKAAVCDNNFILDYYRFSTNNRLLFGGRVSYSTRTPNNLQQIMQKRIESIFPSLSGVDIDHSWGGFVDISMNRAPDFGRIDSNIYYLQGFSGHGVALTQLSGRLIAEAISGDASRFDIFTKIKHREFLGGHKMRTPILVLATLWHKLKDYLT